MSSHNKHFKDDDRLLIEKLLDGGSSARQIASHVGKSERSVSYEVKEHMTQYLNQNNPCMKINGCKVKNICYDCPISLRFKLCRNCTYRRCSDYCDEYSNKVQCKLLKRFPYVCNGCSKKDKCKSTKYFYKAQKAQEIYEFNVSDWKIGPAIDLEEFLNINDLVSKSVKNGHSITAAVKENNLNIHPSTVYHYLHEGQLSIHEIDLPYQVRYKARKKKVQPVSHIDYEYNKGRKFEDFSEYIITHPGINIWQMDTVEGIKGKEESCLLSLLYVTTNLQLYFKMPSQTIEEVNKVFHYIKSTLGPQLFAKTFTVLLTDNGSEFKDPKTIENDEEIDKQLVNVFYCHPSRWDEKAKCERNHRELRRMVPQGISWNPYTESDIIFISNSVNNYYRDQFGASPYQLSKELLNEKVLALNHLKFVPSNQVDINLFIKK